MISMRRFDSAAAFAGAALLAVVTTGCEGMRSARETSAPPAEQSRAPETQTFTATAYALEGLTAAGTQARRGIVAADPGVLPLGTRIRVSDAGRYSGEYVVEDTGAKIKGRIIDIKVGSNREAIEFGRRKVKVEVLERGDGDRAAVRKAAAIREAAAQ